jgi:hypothetical protein
VLNKAQDTTQLPSGDYAFVFSGFPVTVKQRASATPVTGGKTNLSVLGSIPDGEATLKYTWSVQSKPGGAADPTFSVNGTNAAKNTTATFPAQASGTYVFRVTITDQTGLLSATSDVNVTVQGDFTANERFVNAVYVAFLGRPGTRAELDGWVADLPSVGRAGVVDGIMRSEEALSRVVNAIYLKLLNRPAAGDEDDGWVRELATRTATEKQVIAGIAASPEFAARAAALFPSDQSDPAFVKALYTLLLNRPAGANEVNIWVAALPSLGRAGVVSALVGSGEFRGGAVRTFYGDPTLNPLPYQPFFVNLLRRSAPPASGEVDPWVTGGQDLLSIEAAFAKSEEFYQRATL